MRTLTLDELRAELAAQSVEPLDFAFKCPQCSAVQSARDLIAAGAGETFEEVEKYLGFSCVGRWTGAGSPRRPADGRPCNWTLGGLFRVHELEVETPDGEKHPLFAPATPEEAQANAEHWRGSRLGRPATKED